MTEFGFMQVVSREMINALGVENIQGVLLEGMDAPDDFKFISHPVALVDLGYGKTWEPCPDELALWEQWFFKWSINE